MSIVNKLIVVTIVNVASAIGIIKVINMLHNKRSVIKCDTAETSRKKRGDISINVLDRLAAGIQHVSNYLRQRKKNIATRAGYDKCV